jgi:hypothetical protein
MKRFVTPLLGFLVLASLLLGPLAVMADELPKDTNKITRLTREQARELAETFPGVTGADTFNFRDGLPLNGLKELEADVARALAAYSKGPMFLNGLTTLEADTATALAGFKGLLLAVDGLKTLNPTTAKALAQFKGWGLSLAGLTALDAETAKALAKYEGRLGLDGLTTLDVDTAKALAGFKGGGLSLKGLAALDVDAANALASYAGEELYFGGNARKQFIAEHPFGKDTALVHAALHEGNLPAITALDTPDSVTIAQALATRKGPLSLPNLKRISPKTLTALIEKHDLDIPAIETLELIPEPDGSPTEDFVIPEAFQKKQQRQR